MAFDASAFGSWGCPPRLYKDVLELLHQGRVKVRPFVSFHPLDEVNDLLDQAHHGLLRKRAVLVPRSSEDAS